jgi:hypothetical protein
MIKIRRNCQSFQTFFIDIKSLMIVIVSQNNIAFIPRLCMVLKFLFGVLLFLPHY